MQELGLMMQQKLEIAEEPDEDMLDNLSQINFEDELFDGIEN